MFDGWARTSARVPSGCCVTGLYDTELHIRPADLDQITDWVPTVLFQLENSCRVLGLKVFYSFFESEYFGLVFM